MDDGDLRRAYDALAEAARSGEFGSPPAGEWTATQVLAHVIASDRAMCAATAELLDDGEPSFVNDAAQRLMVLDAIVASCEGLDELIVEMRRQGRELCALVQMLDESVAARTVSVHLTDHDDVRVHGPMPWQTILAIHAASHLPTHTAQLESLRN